MRGIQRRSVRRALAVLGVAALTASALVAVGAIAASAVDDTVTVIPASGDPIGVEEGQHTSPQINAPIGPKVLGPSDIVGKFTDTGNSAGRETDCSSDRYLVTIKWGDSTSSEGSFFCELKDSVATGVFDATGDHIYRDSGSYTISLTVTDQDDKKTSGNAVNTDTATISDAALEFDWANGPDGPYEQVEGGSVLVQAAFLDNNPAFPVEDGPSFDPGISATIDWGDGSAVQSVTPSNPPSACKCFGDIGVSASHIYDAPKKAGTRYTITVKVTDDGGSTASVTLSAEISDAALTAGAAKSFVAPAAQSSTNVVANFTDAAGAQAAAGDFTATINWGDGSSSAGTLTQTAAGAFDVKGTHTYATAGTKSLTIKVDDEEGQTLTMTATATVPVLPNTGEPQTPVQPSMPLLPLLALAFGLVIAASGTGLILVRRSRP